MIRKATPEDIQAIIGMASIVFPNTYKDILSSEQIQYMMNMMYSEQSLNRQMTSDMNIFFISEGKGFVSYRFDGRIEDSIDVFHIEKLYVMPQAQGAGLGRRLFETILREAKHSAGGPIRIELNVNRHNHRAISFYEHIGMRKQQEGDFPIGSGFYMNDYIMSLDLLP